MSEEIRRRLEELHGRLKPEEPYRRRIRDFFDFSFVWLKPFLRLTSVSVEKILPPSIVYIFPQDLERPRVKIDVPFDQGQVGKNPDEAGYHDVVATLTRGAEKWPLSDPYSDPELTYFGGELRAFEEGTIVPWSEIAKDIEVPHVGWVERALRTRQAALIEPLQNLALAQRLNRACRDKNLLMPKDKHISPVELRIIHELLQNCDFTSIRHVSEFFDKDEQGDPSTAPDPMECSDHPRICNDSMDFLIHTEPDEHFILIHGPHRLAEAIRKHALVEGFFCKPDTGPEWWMKSAEIGEPKSFSVLGS